MYAPGMVVLGSEIGWACTCGAGEARREQARRDAAARMLGDSGIPKKFVALTLETFKEAGNKSIGHVRAAREVSEWVARPGRPWLIIRGQTGRGKTGLMCSALKLLAARGRSVTFVCSFDMMDEIKKRFGGDVQGYTGALAQVDVLAIDELVPPRVTEWQSSILFELIYRRDAAQLTTLMTTCATGEETVKAVTLSGIRRIDENAIKVVIDGKELRHVSAKEY